MLAPLETLLKRGALAPRFDRVRFCDLEAETSPPLDWLWQGYLAAGNVTLLTSQWKAGKTTLLSILLARMGAGGDLAGQRVRAGCGVVVSEENRQLWRRRCERLELGPQVSGFCRPFDGKPSRNQWLDLIDRLVRMRAEEGLDLAVIDSLGFFCPRGAESQGDAMLDVLHPLERLTAAGSAVLILHHPRKGGVRVGQAARGTGVLSAYCDVLIELHGIANAAADDRRRRLLAWSRHDETPRDVVIELAADGRDYAIRFDTPDDGSERGLVLAIEVLARVNRQLTRRQIAELWPERKAPSVGTLWRWLERGVEHRQLVRLGTGKCGDPFRYTLPGRDVPWASDARDYFQPEVGFMDMH